MRIAIFIGVYFGVPISLILGLQYILGSILGPPIYGNGAGLEFLSSRRGVVIKLRVA